MKLGYCYLCGSKKSHLVHKGTRGGHTTIDVLQCDDCGLVRLSETLADAEAFYRASGMRDQLVETPAQTRIGTRADDERRFCRTEAMIEGKRVLDFGCGDGGYLVRAKIIARQVVGVELEDAMREALCAEGFDVRASIDGLGCFDVITLFHVIEHLEDPLAYLALFAEHLQPGGRLVIETPNAEDALLSLYGCGAFADFTYWHCHVYLYATETLKLLAKKAGWQVESFRQVQRYPLVNHLQWLAKGKPGGHKTWDFLRDAVLDARYGSLLAELGIADTLFTVWKRPEA